MSDDNFNPMDPKNIHIAEQSMTWMAENIPLLWAKMFANCVREGLTETQAMTFMVAYISANHRRV